MAGLLILATVPAAIVGLTIKWYFKASIESPLLAGAMLPITGLMLLCTPLIKEGKTPYTALSWPRALIVGAVQAVAILPGISRSGSTITAGLGVGLSRIGRDVLVPVGHSGHPRASVLELKDLLHGQTVTTPPEMLVYGAVLSFVIGVVSLWWLIRIVEHGRLFWFALWCIPVGLATVAWQLWPLIHG